MNYKKFFKDELSWDNNLNSVITMDYHETVI